MIQLLVGLVSLDLESLLMKMHLVPFKSISSLHFVSLEESILGVELQPILVTFIWSQLMSLSGDFLGLQPAFVMLDETQFLES